jgi:hypothetical protein
MLKKVITFEDFNGEEVSETHYFNLTKTELIELEVHYEGGLEGSINKIIEAQDNATLLREFKKIILSSYGEKSADGKRFIKSDEMSKAFSQSAAFDSLFMELASGDGSAGAAFIAGVLPKDLSEEVAKQDLKAATAKAMSTSEIAAKQQD